MKSVTSEPQQPTTARASVAKVLPVVILGAGPAGLTAAYELTNLGIPCSVLEMDSVVGGIARTVQYKGYRFDIGGHRFFTRITLVEKMWRDILGDDLITRPRLSRIYYNSHFFKYPLDPMDALRGLGFFESALCGLSFVKSRLFPEKPELDFTAWVSNRFGKRLFNTFFKSYTEKVWGMPCREIGAEWAAQRIQGLSMVSLLKDALFPRKDRKIKTLIKEFLYPRLGPGMMWERLRDILAERGVPVTMNAPVERLEWKDGKVTGVYAGGRSYAASHVISSIPIRHLIERLDPAPDYLRAAASKFRYRDFITVALIVKGRDLFPDNWIYVHDPAATVGRIQNFNNWSPEMTASADMTCLGMEYFCNEGDELWSKSDATLYEQAKREVVRLGLVRAEDIVDGSVVRMPKAYPVYDNQYQDGIRAVRAFLETTSNLQLVGRNGMHRYNNQDHSMLTAVLAARNIAGANYDIWKLGSDADYLEKGPELDEKQLAEFASSQPLVPRAM